jgi:hypothetical protein
VASILSREHKYCVKWRRAAPRHIYLRWVEVKDMVTDIDDAPGYGDAGRVFMQPTTNLGSSATPSGDDWLANLRSKLNK